MAPLVYPAKFRVPRLPAAYLPRPRLDASWSAWRDGRLASVIAGAGSGKTTFLAARAHALGDRALWYALDEFDRDPAVMAAHLAAACGRDGAVATLDELLAALVGGPGRRELLVFDDVQLVQGAPAPSGFLQRLLRYLPPGTLLVLASREPLDLPTARWQVQGAIGRLTARDLAFTADEVAALFARRFPGAALGAGDAPRLARATEGWAAGLEIFWQSVGAGGAPDVPAALAAVERNRDAWFDYFVEEVIAQLSPDLRTFLLESSLLPRLEPELCDAVLQRGDSARVLRTLARRQLFTYAADRASYRYHHLFRDCLRELLARERPPAERRRLHRRAAAAMCRRGEYAEACLALAACGETGRALDLLRWRADRLLAQERDGTLREALAALPLAAVNASADALYVQGRLDLLQGRWAEADAGARRALRLAPSAARRARLEALLAQLAMQTGRWSACLARGRRVLAARGRMPAPARADLLGAMGVAACSLGRIDQGEAYLAEACRICRRAGDAAGEGRHLFRLAANVGCLRGDLEDAARAARRALAVVRATGRRELTAHALGVLGFVLAGQGREREARETTEEALREARGIGYRNIEGYCQLTLGTCALLADDPDESAQRFAVSLAVGDELGERSLRTWSLLGLAESAWRAGNRAETRRRASLALSLSRADRDLFCQARALMILGRLEAGAPRRAAAGAPWPRAERLLRRLGASVEQARLRVWRVAAVPAPSRDPQQVRDLLASLARTGQEFVVERLEPAAGRDLVSSLPGDDPVRLAWRSRVGLAPPPPAAAAAPPRGSLTIRALGPLHILRDHDLVAPGAWPSARARRLLQLLIVRRFEPVPREQILEHLWPDADPARSNLSLRQTLYVLRRAFEREGARAPQHVLTRGETIQLDPGDDARYDVRDFEALLRRAQAALGGRRADEAIRSLRAAVDLYRGDLFADCPYESFAEEEAAQLRHRYRRAVLRLVELLDRDRRWDDVVTLCRRGQQSDPLNEDLACRLASALLSLGHRQEALAECHRFEALHARELDLLPSPRLRSLAERALRGA